MGITTNGTAMERCQDSLRSPSSDDEIDPHPTDEMQKFAQCAQSKTMENFRQIAAPVTPERQANPAHARSQRTYRCADFVAALQAGGHRLLSCPPKSRHPRFGGA
jgi:hypothetical protein